MFVAAGPVAFSSLMETEVDVRLQAYVPLWRHGGVQYAIAPLTHSRSRRMVAEPVEGRNTYCASWVSEFFYMLKLVGSLLNMLYNSMYA